MKPTGLFSVVVLVVFIVSWVQAQSENPGVRAILRVYDECSKAEGFSPCLKKKAVTFMDRLARMDKLSVLDGITIIRSNDVSLPAMSEEQLEKTLPRTLEAREAMLDDLLLERAASYVSSRTMQITLPQINTQELGRAVNEGNTSLFFFSS